MGMQQHAALDRPYELAVQPPRVLNEEIRDVIEIEAGLAKPCSPA
jgi:hypothetical protein